MSTPGDRIIRQILGVFGVRSQPRHKLISEEEDLADDLSRLDSEQPGWDREGRIASAMAGLSSGSPRDSIARTYGEEIASIAEARLLIDAEPSPLVIMASSPETQIYRLDSERRVLEQVFNNNTMRLIAPQVLYVGSRCANFADAIYETSPAIVHFCGHPTENQSGISFESSSGEIRPFKQKELRELLATNILWPRMVVLHSCFSLDQAAALAEVVDVVIGVPYGAPEALAAKFINHLYQELAGGNSVKQAFAGARQEYLNSSKERRIRPEMLTRENVNPESLDLSLIAPPRRHRKPTDTSNVLICASWESRGLARSIAHLLQTAFGIERGLTRSVSFVPESHQIHGYDQQVKAITSAFVVVMIPSESTSGNSWMKTEPIQSLVQSKQVVSVLAPQADRASLPRSSLYVTITTEELRQMLRFIEHASFQFLKPEPTYRRELDLVLEEAREAENDRQSNEPDIKLTFREYDLIFEHSERLLNQ